MYAGFSRRGSCSNQGRQENNILIERQASPSSQNGQTNWCATSKIHIPYSCRPASKPFPLLSVRLRVKKDNAGGVLLLWRPTQGYDSSIYSRCPLSLTRDTSACQQIAYQSPGVVASQSSILLTFNINIGWPARAEMKSSSTSLHNQIHRKFMALNLK